MVLISDTSILIFLLRIDEKTCLHDPRRWLRRNSDSLPGLVFFYRNSQAVRELLCSATLISSMVRRKAQQ